MNCISGELRVVLTSIRRRSLGLAISKTRGKCTKVRLRCGLNNHDVVDYAVIEVLLNLFARLLPSASASKAKHNAFIREVFVDNFAADVIPGQEVVDLFEGATTKDWEETATKLFDIFSMSEISL